MSGIQCVNTCRKALYRVFVLSPSERHEALLANQLVPALLQQARVPAQRQLRAQGGKQQARPFSSSPLLLARPPMEILQPRDDERNYDRRYTTKEDVEKSGRGRLPQDFEITDPYIMVLDNGKFNGPMPPRKAIGSLAPDESLRMIQPYVPARPKDGVMETHAICKIVNKAEEYARARQLRERRKQTKAAGVKNVELNWGIGDHDLATKIRRISNFLEKGMKVEVELGVKKRAKKVDDTVAQEVVKRLRKSVEEVGAREFRPEEGGLNRTMRLYFEGKQQQQAQKKGIPEEEASPEMEASLEAEVSPEEAKSS